MSASAMESILYIILYYRSTVAAGFIVSSYQGYDDESLE